MNPRPTRRASERGSTLIEVLITIVILAIGLLSLAALQMRLQANELESYQRAQAITLLDDMRSRIEANRRNAASYITGTSSPLGSGMTCPTDATTRQAIDAYQWCQALQGSAETLSGKVGAMIGARGCIEQMSAGSYMLTIAWQGVLPLAAPPSTVGCGANLYNDTAKCTADRCRRVINTVVNIGTLN